MYPGTLSQNRIHGKGVLRFPDNSEYEGNFIGGLYNGHGRFTNTDNKLVYEGKFLNGLPHGKGVLRIRDFNVFDGEFFHGKKLVGVHVCKNSTFIGQFDKPQFRSSGKYIFNKTKTVYIGAFHKGLPHGIGQLEWNARIYSRVLTSAIPEIFKGYWKHGMKHGLGILQWNHMSIMTIWDNGLKHGSGILIARNGDIFVSQKMFEDNQFVKPRKVCLNHENHVLVEKAFRSKHLTTDQFKLTIKKLIMDSNEIPDVSPFHLPAYQIELNTIPLYKFISNVLSSKGIQSFPEQELKSTNQVIVDQYFKLHEIYLSYANFGAYNKNKTVVMNRLGLWQFLRDLGFDSTRINTTDIITVAEAKFQIIVSNQNDFREPIHFCNFLKYLLYLTTLINKGENNQNVAIQAKLPYFGYFATMFVIFLNNVVLKVVPFSKGSNVKNIIDHDENLIQFLTLCSKLPEKLTIRTAFQCMCVLKGHERISFMNNIWNPYYNTPELLKEISYEDFYQCGSTVFPNIIQNNGSLETEQTTFITNSNFNITPLELYEFFEAIVKVAIKKSKGKALITQTFETDTVLNAIHS